MRHSTILIASSVLFAFTQCAKGHFRFSEPCNDTIIHHTYSKDIDGDVSSRSYVVVKGDTSAYSFVLFKSGENRTLIVETNRYDMPTISLRKTTYREMLRELDLCISSKALSDKINSVKSVELWLSDLGDIAVEVALNVGNKDQCYYSDIMGALEKTCFRQDMQDVFGKHGMEVVSTGCGDTIAWGNLSWITDNVIGITPRKNMPNTIYGCKIYVWIEPTKTA